MESTQAKWVMLIGLAIVLAAAVGSLAKRFAIPAVVVAHQSRDAKLLPGSVYAAVVVVSAAACLGGPRVVQRPLPRDSS